LFISFYSILPWIFLQIKETKAPLSSLNSFIIPLPPEGTFS